MIHITDEQVQAFIDGCKKHQPDCLDNGEFAVCRSCSRILLEIAAEVLKAAPVAPGEDAFAALFRATSCVHCGGTIPPFGAMACASPGVFGFDYPVCKKCAGLPTDESKGG